MFKDSEETLSLSYITLDYDFDSAVPTIYFSIEDKSDTGLSRPIVERLCDLHMKSKINYLRRNHADIFGHVGFTNKNLSEKLKQLEKQMRVEISYVEYTDTGISEFSCVTTGYQQPISKTWR